MLNHARTRSLSLAALALLLLAGAAAAQEPAGEADLGLGLEASEVFEGMDLAVSEPAAEGEEAVTETIAERTGEAPLQMASLAPSPELWQEAAEAQEMEDRVAPPKKGFKRWLKRRWWIPALVGVAAGVVLADDGSGDGED